MNEPLNSEELRADVEARQKSVLWEDRFRNNRTVTRFLWHGDPSASLIQRAGTILFALILLLCSTIAVLSWLQNEPDNRTYLSFVFAFVMLLVAGRLFRNAIMKRKLRTEEHNHESS